MANAFWFLAIVIAAILNAVNGQPQTLCCEEYCYDLDSERPQSSHFSTQTAYQFVRGPESARQYNVSNCTPVKIWMLIRHGTELPDVDLLERLSSLEFLRDEIVNNYEKHHSKPDVGSLCDADLDALKQWQWNRNITSDNAEFLTVQGLNDMKFLAKQYQRAFPHLFENVYDHRKFHFEYTNRRRTEASFKAFVEGLFGENAYRYVQVPPHIANDILLRPFKHCPTWDDADNTAPAAEVSKFTKSLIFTQLISDVSMRLGFKYLLKLEQIENIYEMCSYEQAWNVDQPSVWCAALTPSQVNVLEYREDIKYYYLASYGQSKNTHMQCKAVADMLHHLESRDLPKVVTYFSHGLAMQLLLTALGAEKDVIPLTADNYYTMSRRKWRSSTLIPFGANFAAIKYECPEDVERQKVMFVLNEKPLDFEWCTDGLCNWSDVHETFKRFLRGDCDTSFCQSGAASIAQTLLYVIISVITQIVLRRRH